MGEGILLFQVYCCWLQPHWRVAYATCPQCARHPSLNILFLCGQIQNMLLKEEASKTVIQTCHPVSRAWVKTETYHTPEADNPTTKRVKLSSDDIHMVWVPPASADAQSCHKVIGQSIRYTTISSQSATTLNPPTSPLPTTANKK